MKTLFCCVMLMCAGLQAGFAQDVDFESLIGRYDVPEEWVISELKDEHRKVLKNRPVYLELKAIEGEVDVTYAAMLHDARTKRVIWEATWVADKNDYFDLVRVDDPEVVYNCNYSEDDDIGIITIFNYFGEDQPLVFTQNH
ncbi:MAG: hypothetical protein KF690_10500 [Bacteroidetes bacterium]|nr:hypothetical protein [Bacteroidota bacterium]